MICIPRKINFKIMIESDCQSHIAQSTSGCKEYPTSKVKMEGVQVKSEEDAKDNAFLREWVEPLDCKEDQKLNINTGNGKEDHRHEVVSSDDAFLREWVEPLDCKEDQKINISMTDAKEEKEHDSCPNGEPNLIITSPSNDLTCKKRGSKAHSKAMVSRNVNKRINTDAVITRLCQDAPISDQFASKCEFKCPGCGKCFNTWQAITKHSRKSARTIYFKDIEECIVKIVCHVCRICSEKVLCDGDIMKRHLKTSHKIQLGYYIKKFDLFPLKKLPENAYSNHVIGNLCSYKCKDCGANYTQSASLYEHMKAHSHGVGFKGKDNLIKTIYHTCKLCDKVFLCDLIILRRHVKHSHGLTIDKYCRKTGCVQAEDKWAVVLQTLKLSEFVDNLCLFTCGVCNKILNNCLELRKHRLKTKHYADTSTQSLTTSLF